MYQYNNRDSQYCAQEAPLASFSSEKDDDPYKRQEDQANGYAEASLVCAAFFQICTVFHGLC